MSFHDENEVLSNPNEMEQQQDNYNNVYNNKEWKKYKFYNVKVDPNQDDKAIEIQLCDFSRPHMRAFHCSWWSFFIAFFSWFALTPILSDIRIDLGLSKKQLWDSTIASFSGTIFIRFLLGPLCDKYGARILFTILLCITAIPTALTGFIETSTQLIVLRLCIGLTGGTFVMCQYWTSKMFAKEIVGTANALVAGWGNLGAGVTQIIIGVVFLPFVRAITNNNTSIAPWRIVCIIPAILSFLSGIVVYCISDDTPKGNYSEIMMKMKKSQQHPNHNISIIQTFRIAILDINAWILFIQYGCCFGVELAMNSASTMYFREEFGLSRETASAIASVFGWMNLFARGIGGFLSDYASYYNHYGIRGRLIVQFICLLFEGILVLIFGMSTTILGSILVMLLFSFFVQASEGSTYGIVPYVLPKQMGTVIGIVGAGGNVGAVIFALLFRELNYKLGFQIMGTCILLSAIMTILIQIHGHSSLLWGYNCTNINVETGEIINNYNNDDDENNNKEKNETSKGGGRGGGNGAEISIFSA